MRVCSGLTDFIVFTPIVFFSGFASFFTLLALDIRRRRLALAGLLRLPVLAIFDLLPPALTAGFVAALIAAFYPEAFARGGLPLRSPLTRGMVLCLAFFPIFWTEGRKQIQFQRPFGLLFAEWLVFAGATRILLLLVFHHPGDAQINRSVLFALPSILAGGALIAAVVPQFIKKYEGLRILERVAEGEQIAQPEYTAATPECPQPELWRMLDSQTTEVEVLDFLKTLVTTVKPKLVVETGTFLGHGTVKLAEGLKENGFGKVITIEFDPAIRARAEERFKACGLAPWIE